MLVAESPAPCSSDSQWSLWGSTPQFWGTWMRTLCPFPPRGNRSGTLSVQPVLAWGEGLGWRRFSRPSDAALCWPRALFQPRLWVLGFSQWCLVYSCGRFLGDTELGNNLCCRHDVVTEINIGIENSPAPWSPQRTSPSHSLPPPSFMIELVVPSRSSISSVTPQGWPFILLRLGKEWWGMRKKHWFPNHLRRLHTSAWPLSSCARSLASFRPTCLGYSP